MMIFVVEEEGLADNVQQSGLQVLRRVHPGEDEPQFFFVFSSGSRESLS